MPATADELLLYVFDHFVGLTLKWLRKFELDVLVNLVVHVTAQCLVIINYQSKHLKTCIGKYFRGNLHF